MMKMQRISAPKSNYHFAYTADQQLNDLLSPTLQTQSLAAAAADNGCKASTEHLADIPTLD